jgi:tetratricopeptide (TPR) repeat protein
LIGIEMAMMASFHLQLQALWRAIFRRRRQEFVVTRKHPDTKGTTSGLLRMWPQTLLVALSIIAITWASSRVFFGLSADYFGLAVGSGLAMYHSWLALSVLSRATSKRNHVEQWHHPLCLNVDYSVAGDDKSAVSIEFNENGCRIITWKPIEKDWPLRVIFHTPVGETVGHGQVKSVIPLGHGKPFAYLSNIVFDHVDPFQRERESDVLRGVILRYVLPVVTMTHRLIHQGRALPEELSGEGDFPIPLTIDPNQPNLGVQRSIALSVNKYGFLAALPISCPVGSTAQATLDTPLGPVVAEVEVLDVETMRVGATIVHQHEFHWRNPAAIRKMLPHKRAWTVAINRTIARMRNHRQSKTRWALTSLAGCVIAVATLFLFREINYGDILLAGTAHRPMTEKQHEQIKGSLEDLAASPKTSVQRLLRVYQAAVAVGNNEAAAEAAKHLANRAETGRMDWQLTSARHLVRAEKVQEADAAFDDILAEPMEQNFSIDQRADIYVEAARAAVAANKLDKAVERFLLASNLKATDPEQAEELLGVLIADKQSTLALQVLRQLDRSDRVLRRIVDVYEMADTPEKAVPELEELYRRHPEDAGTVLRLAELAVMRRDFTAGANYYKILNQLEPDNKKAKAKLAESFLLVARDDVAAKRFDEARSMFDESFRLQPPDDKLKREYGGFLATIGDYEQAVAMLEPLKDAESQLQLAAVLEMQGDRTKALEILLDAEKSQPLDEKAQKSIARLLLASGKYEEAANRLIQLLGKEPNDSQLQREFLDAVAASSQWSDAMRQTTADIYHEYQAHGFQALDARDFERLSDALRQLGMFEEARVALEQAVASFPQSRQLRFYLAQTLGNLGRYDDAEVQYVHLLQTRPAMPR